MSKKQEEFLKELLADFRVEAAEHKLAITNGLIELEKNPASNEHQSLVEMIFRETHSFKGAARAVGFFDIERVCQTMETGFSLLKSQSIQISQLFFDKMHASVNLLDRLMEDSVSGNKTVNADQIAILIKELNDLFGERIFARTEPKPKTTQIQFNKESTFPEPSVDKRVSVDTIRVSTHKLDEILLQAEELITVKNTLTHFLHEIKRISNHGKNITDSNLAIENLKKIRNELNHLIEPMDQLDRIMSRTIDDLLLGIKSSLLLPFSSVLDIFPKLIRDLSIAQKKEIHFSMLGSETEIDRRILEEIKDPLIHLVRNSVDHGIESADQRISMGKTAKGTKRIEIKKTEKREVIIEISDDGNGISRKKVLESAVKNGIIIQENTENLTDQEVYNLIFHSGLSTSPYITDISGRGLGLAIVAEKVSRLGGSIMVDSKPGKGCTFKLCLPLTIATFRGILVKVSEQLLIIPTHAIERVIRIVLSEIKTVENQDTLTIDDKVVGLMRLVDVIGIPEKTTKRILQERVPVLILNTGQRRMAFMVDEIIDEQEGIAKMFGSQMNHVQNITAVTVLGNGKIVPILNVTELMESAKNVKKSIVSAQDSMVNPEEETEKKSVLVAEDSITARSLLRNIIESAGYQVKTAVDGMEAFHLLQNESFDLVVSDIEMPRMNGFELTTRIRDDKKLEELPLILVTALDSSEDRQRGMECGANAYIVKSSFEQSNLLEVIKRLI